MVEESGVVPTRQETTCKTGLRLIGRLGDGSKWVVDGRWVASMLKGKEKGRRGQKRTGREREREGGGTEKRGKERYSGTLQENVSRTHGFARMTFHTGHGHGARNLISRLGTC